MDGCSSVSQFWIALPATIGALAAFVATLKNRTKISEVKTTVNGNLERVHERLDVAQAALVSQAEDLGRAEGGD